MNGQPQSHLSSSWNYAVPYIELNHDEKYLGSGSSFFWRAGNRTLLVTNWHNLAGTNPLTGQIISRSGLTPNRITAGLFKQVSDTDSHGFYELKYQVVAIPLRSESLAPRWIEHPHWGRHVDIAAIDVTHEVQGLHIAHVNELENDAVLETVATQEVFTVGYPFGLLSNAPAPIWKRGSIALDPTFDVEGLPKMLIDTATREGMSGSVVIARHIIFGQDYLKKDGTRSPKIIYGKYDTVVGVYSGRHYPDLERAQLGIVWKRRVIEEIAAVGQ